LTVKFTVNRYFPVKPSGQKASGQDMSLPGLLLPEVREWPRFFLNNAGFQ